MAKGTGFGSFILQIAVSIQRPHDRLIRPCSSVLRLGEVGVVATFKVALKGKLGDDETISYEIADIMTGCGVPRHAWSIDWDMSDWQFTDAAIEKMAVSAYQ